MKFFILFCLVAVAVADSSSEESGEKHKHHHKHHHRHHHSSEGREEHQTVVIVHEDHHEDNHHHRFCPKDFIRGIQEEIKEYKKHTKGHEEPKAINKMMDEVDKELKKIEAELKVKKITEEKAKEDLVKLFREGVKKFDEELEKLKHKTDEKSEHMRLSLMLAKMRSHHWMFCLDKHHKHFEGCFIAGIEQDLVLFGQVIKEDDKDLKKMKDDTSDMLKKIKAEVKAKKITHGQAAVKVQQYLEKALVQINRDLEELAKKHDKKSCRTFIIMMMSKTTVEKWIGILDHKKEDKMEASENFKCEKDFIKAIERDLKKFDKVVKEEDKVLIESKEKTEKLIKEIKEKKMSHEEARKKMLKFLEESEKEMSKERRRLMKENKEEVQIKRYEKAIECTRNHIKCIKEQKPVHHGSSEESGSDSNESDSGSDSDSNESD